MAPLVTGHDVKTRGEEIDDLSLAFVAPLGAQDDDISHGNQTQYCTSRRKQVRCEMGFEARPRLRVDSRSVCDNLKDLAIIESRVRSSEQVLHSHTGCGTLAFYAAFG